MKYLVKTPIQMSGKLYSPGDSIALNEQEAIDLVHAIGPMPEEETKAPDAGKGKEKEKDKE